MKNLIKVISSRIDYMYGEESSFKKFWRKHFGLPTVIELGWSDHNALEMAEFSDEPKGKTWEDYYAHMKQLYPFRYFINETLPDFLKHKIWWRFSIPAEKLRYFLVSHLIPSRRYHMLDLRQKNGYRYGWSDTPERMMYAMFNLLDQYITKEEPYDLTESYSKEEIDADTALTIQQNNLIEARTIHHWWTVERTKEKNAIGDLLHLWAEARKNKNPGKEKYWNQLNKMKDDFENKGDEMIIRLMKIRKSLWT